MTLTGGHRCEFFHFKKKTSLFVKYNVAFSEILLFFLFCGYDVDLRVERYVGMLKSQLRLN